MIKKLSISFVSLFFIFNTLFTAMANDIVNLNSLSISELEELYKPYQEVLDKLNKEFELDFVIGLADEALLEKWGGSLRESYILTLSKTLEQFENDTRDSILTLYYPDDPRVKEIVQKRNETIEKLKETDEYDSLVEIKWNSELSDDYYYDIEQNSNSSNIIKLDINTIDDYSISEKNNDELEPYYELEDEIQRGWIADFTAIVLKSVVRNTNNSYTYEKIVDHGTYYLRQPGSLEFRPTANETTSLNANRTIFTYSQRGALYTYDGYLHSGSLQVNATFRAGQNMP